MNVEKDRQLKDGFARLSLVVSPITGIIAVGIVVVCRINVGNQVAALLLTFCLVTLVAAIIMRAIGWVVRGFVAGEADKKEKPS
jgi:uncharacterized membrane protein